MFFVTYFSTKAKIKANDVKKKIKPRNKIKEEKQNKQKYQII